MAMMLSRGGWIVTYNTRKVVENSDYKIIKNVGKLLDNIIMLM